MYSFESRVRYSECDGEGVLSLVGLVNYLQDCSTFHSESLGHGVRALREQGIAWFISAWQIEIARMPRFFEDITVSTWCYEAARTQAHRNFAVRGQDGETLVRADSLWFVYDVAAARPVRIPESEMVYVSDDARLDMPETRRRLPVEGPFTQAEPIVVSSQHLDTNGHVNNAQYVLMAASALGEGRAPGRVCVQYRRMALPGDVIVPRVHVADGSRTVDLASPDGDTYAVVRLEG